MMVAGSAMGALADGTGGTFFDNINDLGAGFRRVAEAPELVYLLELSLDGVKADGAYHKLKVKVDREGVEVQARRGYFMAKAR
jgi:VWFA-related protein